MENNDMLKCDFITINESINKIYGSDSENFLERVKDFFYVINSIPEARTIAKKYMKTLSKEEYQDILFDKHKEKYFNLPKSKGKRIGFILKYLEIVKERGKSSNYDTIAQLAYPSNDVKVSHDKFILCVCTSLNCFLERIQMECYSNIHETNNNSMYVYINGNDNTSNITFSQGNNNNLMSVQNNHISSDDIFLSIEKKLREKGVPALSINEIQVELRNLSETLSSQEKKKVN